MCLLPLSCSSSAVILNDDYCYIKKKSFILSFSVAIFSAAQASLRLSGQRRGVIYHAEASLPSTLREIFISRRFRNVINHAPTPSGIFRCSVVWSMPNFAVFVCPRARMSGKLRFFDENRRRELRTCRFLMKIAVGSSEPAGF